MPITQNDLELLKAEIMTDTPDGGGLPTGVAIVDGESNNLLPDVSDIDRLCGRVRLRKIYLAVKTANADLLQAPRLLFTEIPENENVSVFAFKSSSFADRRASAQDNIESYLAFGTKWAGHLLETQLTGQRVIQVSLDKDDPIPSVSQPLVLVQNEGQVDEYYQYIRPVKVDTTERRFQKNATDSVLRTVTTIEFGDTLSATFSGLTVQEFFQNASTSRRAVLRETRVADAAKYYSASRLAEPVEAMVSRQVKLESIYTRVVPSTEVETPIPQRDAANQVASQAGSDGIININQSATINPTTAFNLPSGVSVGTLNISFAGISLIDKDGQLVNAQNVAYASIKYGTGQIVWYDLLSIGQQLITGTYKPASEIIRVAQSDYQIVGSNAGYNYIRQLGAEPTPNSLKITYTVGGSNYLVHDDGRGILIDDDGNGRGTVQGKTVLLTTAAIPDADSYIIYSFGVDLDTVKYSHQTLQPAYHSSVITDVVVGNIALTWGTGKTATVSNGVIAGDATGTFSAGELRIAPKLTVPVDTVFTATYSKVLDSVTTAIDASYSPQNANGVFTASLQLGENIEDLSFSLILSDKTNPQIMLYFRLATDGVSLFKNGVYYPAYYGVERYSGNGATIGTVINWLPYNAASGGDWQPTILSNTVNKATGKVDFSIKVARKETVTDVSLVGAINKQPVFSTKTIDTNLFIDTAKITGTATVGGTTEQVSVDIDAGGLFISPPQASDTPVVSGSVFIDALGRSLHDENGQVKDSSQTVGVIDIRSGVIKLSEWESGQANLINLKSMLRQNDPVPLANLIFRTPVAPLKEASLQISGELADGTQISLSTDEQGGITGNNFAHGTVDFKAGVVALYFYERLGVTANPSIVNESWYDANNIYMENGTNYIDRPVYVKPDSVKYNALAYTYLPLDKNLIGLDPVRLPTDGRVPFVRKGDGVAITELKTMILPTYEPNDTFDLGFERLSDVNVIDANGLKIDSDYLDVDLDAGTLQLNGMFDMSFYTAPLTAK